MDLEFWHEGEEIPEWPGFRQNHKFWTSAAKHMQLTTKSSVLLTSKYIFVLSYYQEKVYTLFNYKQRSMLYYIITLLFIIVKTLFVLTYPDISYIKCFNTVYI